MKGFSQADASQAPGQGQSLATGSGGSATESVMGGEHGALGITLVRGWTKRWMVHRARFLGGGSVGAGVREAELFQRVLVRRGLADPLDAAAFIEPKLTGLADPTRFVDMDRAAQRLLSALSEREPIVIYGDYDVDGITATCIVYRMLKAIAPSSDVRTYVPHRLEEGYGLNGKAIEQLASEGAKVVVSVDCGVTAVGPALVAKQVGVDLIITDHHNPPSSAEDLPDAYAVVHPRHPLGQYPFGELSGAGVAYKLAWRLAAMASPGGRATGPLRTLLVELLAPAALGAIADVVPLVGENRIITAFGLGRMKRSSILGLQALAEAARLTGNNVSEWDVGFRLAPRLNACGRMLHAREAVELFLTDDPTRATEIAEMLEAANTQRRAVEQAIVEQASEMVVARGMDRPDHRAIVLSDPNWHAGVVGICCSRLVERFGRPVILMQQTGDEVHGSGRSIDGYNLHAGIGACQEHVLKFGGHDMAAGLRVHAEKLEAFTRAFVAHATAHISIEDLTHKIDVDAVARVGEITLRSVEQIAKLAPFGRGNPRVKVMLEGAKIASPPRLFGKRGEHLELIVEDCQNGGARIRLTAWRWGEHAERIVRGMPIRAVIEPTIDTYGGAKAAGDLVDLAEA